jgi:hypothetical protein
VVSAAKQAVQPRMLHLTVCKVVLLASDAAL